MLKKIPLIRFFADLEKDVECLFDHEGSAPFTLVLGAGASRSAGIPVTREMIELLQLHLKLSCPNLPLADVPNTFTELIGAFYDIEDEWGIRDFFRRCIRRGSREPNLVHLIAANLACAGVFKPIVTTNFDDLALAAFWGLPPNEGYSEPYVIYDPKMVRSTRIRLGEETPVIIKAHGHHTQYGMGIIEEQIRGLAPFVKRIMRIFSTPRIGYIVAGCSGSWPDGIIDVLKDDRLTRGKIIYWFHQHNLSNLDDIPVPLREVVEHSDVRFIRCDDLDYLFVKMWAFFKGPKGPIRGSAWIIDEIDLFTAPTSQELIHYGRQKSRGRWWKPARRRQRLYLRKEEIEGVGGLDNIHDGLRIGTRKQHRQDLGIPALRRSLSPLLAEIDRWDTIHLMPYDCLPLKLKRKFDLTGVIESLEGEAPGLEELREVVSPRVPWTRRNRHLLKIALASHTDPFLSHDLLRAIDGIDKLCWV